MPKRTFTPGSPGEGWRYSNVAFGLAGFLVERLSGETFTAYTRRHIFQPLGMLDSGWLLSEVDAVQHAVPYALPGTPAEWARLYALQADRQQDGQPIPLCLYSFPNLSDGLLRTSVRQLARYAAAFLDPDRRDLFSSRGTLQRIFTTEVERVDEEVQPAPGMGLTWFSLPHPQNPGKIQAWGHDGGDPGVNTRLQLSFERRAAVIVFCNCNISRAAMDALSESIWQAGE